MLRERFQAGGDGEAAQNEGLGQRNTDRFEARCGQNPRARTTAHGPKGDEIEEKES